MRKKHFRRFLSCTTAVILLFANSAAFAVHAIDAGNSDADIAACAAKVKEVYKANYPDKADVIDDVVDIISSDDIFIDIFNDEGPSAFQIVEDSLCDTLDPEPLPMPMMTTDDLYTSEYSFPDVQQSNGYYCGPASTLMALIGSGANGYYYTNDKSTLDRWQESIADELETTKKDGTCIKKITSVLNEHIIRNEESHKYKYKSKAFTIHSYQRALDFIISSLIYDAVPVIKINDTSLLRYYNGASFGHYVVVDYVDFNAETVMLRDPHYDSKYYGAHVISYEEFNNLAKESRDLWVSVYTSVSSDDSYIYD